MIVVFYDRKNKRIVRSNQLFSTNVVAEVIQGDSQESSMLKEPLNKLLESDVYVGEDASETPTPAPGLLSWHTIQLGDVGYKSEKCPSYQNWDMHCMTSDLVFLDLEDEDHGKDS